MIKNKVKLIMQKTFELDTISDDISQKDNSNWDSLKHLSLIVALEDEFKLSFEPSEIQQMTSFNEIMEILSEKCN